MKSSTNNNPNSEREWLKVSELSAGMQIAVPKAECFASFGSVGSDDSVLEADKGDVMWDEIAEIRECGEEQVWDIEVEGTHNFVAGHLIDKNTKNQLSVAEEAAYLMSQEGVSDEEREKLSVIAREGNNSRHPELDSGSAPDDGKQMLNQVQHDDSQVQHDDATDARNDTRDDKIAGQGTKGQAGKAKAMPAAGRDIFYGAIFAHNTYITGSTGIGTSTPWGKLAVENTGSGHSLIVGDEANDSTPFVISNAGNVGIGTTTPGSLLSVGNTGGINFKTATSTFSTTGGIDLAGGCFAVNGTCIGGGAGGAIVIDDLSDAITTATGFFMGSGAGVNEDGGTNYNTGIGINALNAVTGVGGAGENNTAVGYHALTLTTGGRNTAVGANALAANTTGNYNMAFGDGALQANQTGEGNVAVGYNALSVNTANLNTAIGSNALVANLTGIRNFALGNAALGTNTAGSNNVAIGVDALYQNKGSANIAIGRSAGSNYDGSGSVFIGDTAGANESGSNKLYIENSTSATPLIGGDFSLDEIYLNGNVGIATSTPGYGLHVGSVADPKDVMIAKGALCVDDDDACGGALTDGSVYAVGAYSQTADYAEYFYSEDLDLESGELVCVDVAKNNAVKRCQNGADGNLMGIVSTAPAFTGNATNKTRNNPNYKIIGMLGQLPTFVSDENGPIRPGDSLTSSATIPGFAARAQSGDPTVGVALEGLSQGTGKINVLVSRRNKSLTVAQVESAVVERIAAMEIEDEVAILVANAVSSYNFDPIVEEKITQEVDALEVAFGLALSSKVAELEEKINANKLAYLSEKDGKVSVITDLTVTGELEANGGITVPLLGLALNEEGNVGSGTAAFKVALDGTVTAFNDFIIGIGENATSVKSSLAALLAQDMIKTNLTARENLEVGNSFTVWGEGVLGEQTARPSFKIASDGSITVRDDIVLSGYSDFKNIPGIVDVKIYNTSADTDAGAWTNSAQAKSSSWYNEPIDASSKTCSIESDNRCGLRPFPAQAIIAASSNALYLFDAKDGSLWMKFSGRVLSDHGAIQSVHALNGSLFMAQEQGILEIDFRNDKARFLGSAEQNKLLAFNGTIESRNDSSGWTGLDEIESPLISSENITSIKISFINQSPYLAVGSALGIDLINLETFAVARLARENVSSVFLTGSGDLYFTEPTALSVIYKAHTKGADLEAIERYDSESFSQLADMNFAGLQVIEQASKATTTNEILGNRIYASAGSAIVSISENRKPNQKAIIELFEQESGNILNFSVDEQAGVVYAATETSLVSMSGSDGRVIENAQTKEYSAKSAPVAGASSVAGFTMPGSLSEQSDILAIAAPDGVFVQSSDYSLRALAMSGSSKKSPENMGRIAIANDAVFSGRLVVKDQQETAVFAIDEITGNVLAREDMLLAQDSRMMSLSGGLGAFVYSATEDSDGGKWRDAHPQFSQKTIIAWTSDSIRMYDSQTKNEKIRITGEDYEGILGQIGAIKSVSAKDHMLGIAGENGVGFVDLLDDSARFIANAEFSGLALKVSFENVRGRLYGIVLLDSGASVVDMGDYSSAVFSSIQENPVSALLSENGDLYLAYENKVIGFYGAGFNPSGSREPDIEYASLGVKAAQAEFSGDPLFKDGSILSDIALASEKMFVGHSKGISVVDLKDNSISYMEQSGETGEFTVFEQSDDYAPSAQSADIKQITYIGSNSFIVSSEYQGKSYVSQISENGIVLDAWSSEEEREDRNGIPYSSAAVLTAHSSGNVFAIATMAQTGDEFVWMESRGFSLRESKDQPKSVFTVLDRLQTPNIASARSLSLSAKDKISFNTGTSSAPVLVVDGAADDQLAVSAKESASILLSSDFGSKGAWRLFSGMDGEFGIMDKNSDNLRFSIDSRGNIGIGEPSLPARLSIAGQDQSNPVVAISQDNADAVGAVLALRQRAHSMPVIVAQTALASGEEPGSAEIYLSKALSLESGSEISLYEKGTNDFAGMLTIVIQGENKSATAFVSFSASENPTAAIVSQGGDYEFSALAGEAAPEEGQDSKAIIKVLAGGIVKIENNVGENIDVVYQMMR